jgi:diguanylate cyclase (GGDEF)-like protein
MLDVDDFKAVNDTYGHAQGDRVLRDLSAALLRGARAHDVVGRYAGDEFVVLYLGVDRALAESLVARLSATLREQRLSCSIGAALFPQDATDAASLLAAADRALYETKRGGKNGFRFAEAGDARP